MLHTNMLQICIFMLSLFYVQNSAFSMKREWGKEADCVGEEFNGTCIEPHRCLSTNPFVRGLVHPLPCTLKGGKPGVCCTDCELVTNSSDVHLDHGTGSFLWKTGEKAWDKCIEYAQRFRYVGCPYNSWLARHASKDKCHVYFQRGASPAGGTNVVRGEYPHMALLGYRDSQNASQWLCSGSLISDRFILTAGHCLHSRDLGPVTPAAFGLLKRSDPPELWRRYKIKRAVPHPGFKPPKKYHDIALLETETPVIFEAFLVIPACLPTKENKVKYDVDPKFKDIYATGWGNLGYHKDQADTMQKVSLERFNEEECSELYPPYRHLLHGINTTTQMCYGHRTLIRDTCQGDSGGPLQLDTRCPTCMHTLLGVTSYGRECGFQGGAGVYTKIEPYLPWIESVVWPRADPALASGEGNIVFRETM